jgi:hypothetical protein
MLTAGAASAQTRTAPAFNWQGRVAQNAIVEVRGVNGSIVAVAGEGSLVRVEATRSGRRDDPAAVRIAVVEHAAGVTICAVYPSVGGQQNECAAGSAARIGAVNNDVKVEFTVYVPANVNFSGKTANGPLTARGITGRVEATSANGNVTIEGGRSVRARTSNGSIFLSTEGSAEASTSNGQIIARLASLDGTTPITLSTTNGSITLAVPAEANATIEASTLNGRIESELPVTAQGRTSRNRLNGVIGSGSQRISLRTTNGVVVLQKI